MGYFLFIMFAFCSSLLLQFNFNTAQPSPSLFYSYCPGSNYTRNSIFELNLNSLLSTLSSTDEKSYSSISGNDSDKAYGIFQCRGDATSEVCKNCVQTAAKEIKQSRCAYRREAIIWYDVCSLRYSDNSSFSLGDVPIYVWNSQNVTDPDRFMQTREDLMTKLVKRAVSNNGFAIGDVNFTKFQTLYGLVQCYGDIINDCERCLRNTLAQLPLCCDRKQGGGILNPSCNFWYDMYPFYQSQVPRAPPPPRITPVPDTKGQDSQEKSSSKAHVVIIVVPTAIVVILVSTISICFILRRRRRTFYKVKENFDEITKDAAEMSSVEYLQYNFGTIRDATDNFSDANKLGHGGFGSVYKGKLSDGQEIAVKRLSRDSGQGVEEFKNEALLLVKLQHRNLVKLLGFCLEGVEKLLIYEFVPNASLDHFIFDPIKRTYLDWEKRYKIIGGIARGLLYLHEDSRHRIIHRDLKAGNILLDAQMNPKIADFGMARLFVMDETQGNTNRIVGTYGYMAPEYAMHGEFSVKSDVFSFGVLILEIISGQKNKCFYQSEHVGDLLSCAWRYWETGTALELIEPMLKENYSSSEVVRCIHIGLLCVQEDVALRPTMATVVYMLNSYSVTLPLPSTPGFFVNNRHQLNRGKHGTHTDEPEESIVPAQSMICSTSQSINEVTMTEPYPR